MKTPNEKETDKRISSLLSAVERQAAGPDRQFLEELQANSTAEFLRYSAKGAEPSEGAISMWRAIMQSRITKLAAAVMIAGVVGLYLFFGDGQGRLYAQVMEAFEQAGSIYAVGYSFEDGQKKKAYELWYQRDLGLRTEEVRRGKTHARLDDGRYEWEYLEGNDFAVQTQNRQGHLRLPGELTEPSRYLKDCVREPKGDITLDSLPSRLYVRTRPANGQSPAVKSMIWIDEQMRFRRYEERQLLGGLWQTIELATISYDVPIAPELFAADFGPDVKIIKAEDVTLNLFPLEGAIATKEVAGLVFAVHELKRNGAYVFTTCSIRPADNIRDELRNYKHSGDQLDPEHYGDISLTSWWQRRENGELEERPYAHTMLGYYQVGDVLIRCFASLPKAQWAGVDDEFELSVSITPFDRLRELLAQKGQSGRAEVFRPLFTLPLPAEDTPFDEIAANMYEVAKLMAPLKPIRLEPRPSSISVEEFTAHIERKLVGLRPMEELWQSVGSQVVVKLVDKEGRPIVGARIGSDIRSQNGQLHWYYQNGQRDCAVSDADGKVVLQGQQMFHPGASRQNSCMLFAVQEQERSAGLTPVTDRDFGQTIQLTMLPACRVHGLFVCPELNDRADTLNRSVNTYLSYVGQGMVRRVLCHDTDKQQFEALLPPGRYEMNCESHDANRKWIARANRLLDVPANKPELDLGQIVLKPQDYE
jgi:hypothetical protein